MKKILLIIAITFLIFQMVVLATPWDVSTATYSDKCKSVNAQDTEPFDVTFSSDGAKMYVMGYTNDTVFQYTLSTPWDVSTATYDNISKSVNAQDSLPYDVVFNPNGTKMYVAGNTGDRVYQYTLSTAWNVSTASYDTISKSISQEGTPCGIAFKSDGAKMYIVGTAQDTVFQYTLSTPWVVDTASYDNVYKAVGTEDTTPYDVTFNSDGTKMYVMGNTNNTVFQYTLSTPWVVDTASYNSVYKAVGDEDTSPLGVAFKSDGTEMYVMGNTHDTVYQYTMPGEEEEEGNAIFFGFNF